MAYQSLYRRYRPQRFGDMKGQEHVVKALRNAVREDRVGHAYLLSGPRGTGKTTAARILAKVLNCTDPSDGEPCGECDSCQSIESGTSFDLHELDAASNNKVDDIRELLSRVALGTPGRSKVYLLDEVHMLTPGAENALLKTLEEPPDHVTFVLATTEPHKVVATIRSRTQHLRLNLIASEEMSALVGEVVADAGLDVSPEAIEHVVRMGGGSARDTLSALDQVVAAGGLSDEDTSTADLLDALVERDAGRALAAIEAANGQGVDPRRIGERFIDALRSVFLVKMSAAPPRLSESEQAMAAGYADRLSPATITRSLETIGTALVDMRQAPDPRIDLEVAFVRITDRSSAGDTGELEARIEALEAALASGARDSTVPHEAAKRPTTSGRPADAARAALKSRSAEKPAPARPDAATPADDSEDAPSEQNRAAPPPPSAQRKDESPEAPDPPRTEPSPTAEPAAAAAPLPVEQPSDRGPLTVDEVRAEWSQLLDSQTTKARARFLAGDIRSMNDGVLVIEFPTAAQVERCTPYTKVVEEAMANRFGRKVAIKLVVASAKPAASSRPAADQPAADDEVDLHDLTDAESGKETVVERIADVFPGAEVMSNPES